MKNRFERITVVDWNGGGDFCGNSVTPETTGSGHAREKRRPRNGNQRPFVRKGVLKLEIISVHPNI